MVGRSRVCALCALWFGFVHIAQASLYVNASKVREANVSVAVGGTATVTLLNSSSSSTYTPYYEPSASEFYTVSLASSTIPKGGSTTMTIRGVKATPSAQTITMWKNSQKGDTSVAINITVTGGDAPGGDDPDDPTPTDVNLFSVTPYVQHPATNAMTILFFTTTSCRARVMCWRADGKGETNVAWTACEDVSTALGKNPKDSSDSPRFSAQYRHRVRFENLRTHTDYAYVVMPEGGKSYANVFRTLPDRNTPVRFIGICDTETQSGTTSEWDTHSGSGGAEKRTSYYVSRSVGYASNIVHMVARKPDLITISGDLAAKGGYQKYWDEFWRENAGGLGLGYNDPAGSIPILAAIGNHDLKEKDTIDSSGGGENPLKKYLTYFEFNSNGVHYAVSDGTSTPETRDMSQLFHREDLGPVTLIFLDTNKGDNGDYTKETQHYSQRPNMRSPDFHPGTLQYAWLTNNLADAQQNSRFTFVINHHCPYSVGIHNREQGKTGYDGDYANPGHPDGESARAVRVLTETMIRYGVDGWLCGHDEIQEHSQTNGVEVLPDGTTRPHTLNVYDLGSGGDGLRGKVVETNPLEVFRAYENEPDTWTTVGGKKVLQSGGCHYGHLEVDVTTNRLGKWTCSLTPVYIFIYKDENDKICGFERRCYKDRLIIDESSNALVYQEWKGDTALPEDHLEYVRPPQMADAAEDDPPLAEASRFSVTPYVQHPSSNAMSVLFFTREPGWATVWCHPEGAADTAWTNVTIGVEATNLVSTGHSSDVPVWGTQYRHRVRFEGLLPGTTYRYGVRLAGDVAYTNAFRTVPGRDTPVKFVAYSDSETTPDATPTTEWQRKGYSGDQSYYVSRSVGYAANIRHMKAWNPDLIVIAGDLVARGGVQMFWDEFWRHNAGANAGGFNDPAGSIPILAAPGNHDLYDNSGVGAYSYNYDEKGERGLRHFLSYFEFNPNDVDYAHATGSEQDLRDKSQLFHREDYGPVTLLFLDTNNRLTSGMRSPDYSPNSLQYAWLVENLADAQKTARFVFVVTHNCPYTVGKHIQKSDGQTSYYVREYLKDVMIRYGVTAWLCGHDEIQEHSEIFGTATLPDGSTRPHTVHVYDLGSAGDGLRGAVYNSATANAYEVFRAYEHAADGTHYGHLQVEVRPNAKGVWQCTMTPMYSYMWNASGESELRAYKDRVVIDERGKIVYEQRKGVTLVEGEGAVEVGDGGAVTVSESVREIEGASPENVKVVYSDAESGESYDITGAFSVAETNGTPGTSGTSVAIRLNPKGAVPLQTGSEIETIPVTPTLTEAGEAVEPLSVGETTSVGVKTIPGLTYRLKRSESVVGVSQGEVVAEEQARGPRTCLTDPMEGGKPDKAFYSVEVNTAR